MQIVLNNDETTQVLAYGLRGLHGFDSKIIDLDIIKQRTGEVITTVTLDSPNGKVAVKETEGAARLGVSTNAKDGEQSTPADDTPQVNETDPESSGSVFD